MRDKFKYNQSFSIDFCNEFLNKYQVAVVPGIAFGMDDYIRISFACSEEEFIEGLNRLEKFILEIMDTNN